MTDLLRDWWLVFLLAYLPQLAVMVSSLLLAVVASRLDHAIPDDLPMTAGEWLAAQLERGGPSNVRAVVTDGISAPSIDGFHRRHGIIQLRSATYFKSDPVYWGIAAHELGHARLQARYAWLETAVTLTGLLKRSITAFGLALVVGNILYALPGVTVLGFQLLAAALVLDAPTLVEEAIASRSGWRLLSQDGALSRRQLHAVRVTMWLAFCTHLARFLSFAVLLGMWEHIVTLTATGLLDEVARPLGPAATTVVVAATALGVIGALLRVTALRSSATRRARLASRPSAARAIGVLRLLEDGCSLAAIALLWDLSADPTYAWCVMLAMVPSKRAIVALFRLPFSLGYVVIRRLCRAVEGRHGVEPSAAFLRALRAGAMQMRVGNRWIAGLRQDDTVDAPVTQRLGALAPLLHLPLLVMYWLA